MSFRAPIHTPIHSQCPHTHTDTHALASGKIATWMTHSAIDGHVSVVDVGECPEVPPSSQLVHRLIVTQVTIH